MSDPYATLELSPDASAEEVSKAYRRLAKKYHPDVNDSPEAARKMSEINAAYERIKSGDIGQDEAASPGYAARGYGSAGQAYGGWSGDFDPFAAFFGGGYARYGQAPAGMDAAEQYLRAGFYGQALAALAATADRPARWHYLSAVAAAGIGDLAAALEYARDAVRMEPGNAEYQRVLARLQNGAASRSRSAAVPSLGRTLGKILLGLVAWRLFSFLFFGL
ncbi:DnaJ domain-containing protein [bacterium]|nr:DnaJ domain-containing protein [bacterium]